MGGFRSFAATAANGEVAPIPVIRVTTIGRLKSTHSAHRMRRRWLMFDQRRTRLAEIRFLLLAFVQDLLLAPLKRQPCNLCATPCWSYLVSAANPFGISPRLARSTGRAFLPHLSAS